MLPVFCQKQPVMACMMQAYVYSYSLRTGFLGALRHACRLSLPRRFAPFAFAGATRRLACSQANTAKEKDERTLHAVVHVR